MTSKNAFLPASRSVGLIVTDKELKSPFHTCYETA